jgi:hypothetical protein
MQETKWSSQGMLAGGRHPEWRVVRACWPAQVSFGLGPDILAFYPSPFSLLPSPAHREIDLVYNTFGSSRTIASAASDQSPDFGSTQMWIMRLHPRYPFTIPEHDVFLRAFSCGEFGKLLGVCLRGRKERSDEDAAFLRDFIAMRLAQTRARPFGQTGRGSSDTRWRVRRAFGSRRSCCSGRCLGAS